MKLGTIVTWSFIASFIIPLIGAYLKITHSQSAEPLIIIGLIANLIFIVSAIFEVRTSKRIDNFEKTIWTIAFIFFWGISGLFYFFIGRRNVAENIKFKAKN